MRGAWDEGEEGNNLCLKVILKSSTYFFYFSKQKAINVGRGGEPSVVGNESDSHKMCFSEPRGLFYILWHEDTKRKLFFRSLVGLHTLLGWNSVSPPFLSQRLLSQSR